MTNASSVRAAKTGYIILSLCLCAFGAVMVLRPGLSLRLMTDVTGIILICFGGIKVWGYLSKDLYRLAFQHGLATGILAIAVGVVLLVRNEVLVSTLCLIFGITALLDALTKIEMSVEARSFGLRSWWVILTIGLITGCIGFLLAIHPWEGASIVITLLGIALFVEGVLNLITALTAIKVYEGPGPQQS